jgi:hypothetical protein
MNLRNYSVFGCAIYINNINKQHQYTFWIEDEDKGNSEVLFVNWEKFYLKTYIDDIPKRSIILHCKNCKNLKCEFNPEFHKNKAANIDINIIFYPDEFEEKRKEKRINILLKAQAYILDNFIEEYNINVEPIDIKITNISKTGCNISFNNIPENKIPNIGSNLEVYLKSNVVVKKVKVFEQITIFKLKETSPIIGEVVWRMQNNIGIEFISIKNKDGELIKQMVEYLYDISG